MRVLAISGSLRAGSSNSAALQALALVAPPGVEVVPCEALDALPYFNPDLDGETPPAAVGAFRAAVGTADALAISSPEYARGIAGVLKNALDWLVASFEFPGKPVLILNTSPRAEEADRALRLVLATMSARLAGEASTVLPLLGQGLDAAAIAADPALAASLRDALDDLARLAAV